MAGVHLETVELPSTFKSSKVPVVGDDSIGNLFRGVRLRGSRLLESNVSAGKG